MFLIAVVSTQDTVDVDADLKVPTCTDSERMHCAESLTVTGNGGK